MLSVGAGVAVAAAAMWATKRSERARAAVSQLTVESTPAGLEVAIAGEKKGRTPLTLELPPGDYAVQIGSGARQRVLTATLVPGGSLVERVEMAPAPVTGSLRVESEPSGRPVLVDGIERGKTPLMVADLAPGDHQVVVAGESSPTRRTVAVRPNETVSLIISAAVPPSASAGWIAVAAPLSVEMRENGKIIGSSDMERVMLPAGSHTIDFSNDALGYRAQRKVSIAPGATARVTLEPPRGTLNINAQPWAEVWLDGRRLGETPIANVPAAIGTHEVLFRHPELGEKRATVSVGLKEPARIGIDMRRN